MNRIQVHFSNKPEFTINIFAGVSVFGPLYESDQGSPFNQASVCHNHFCRHIPIRTSIWIGSRFTFQSNLNFSLSFLRGGSRSPLPIFGPSGLIEKIHTYQNCQNNYQSCLDFLSLFLQGTDVIPRHPYLVQVWSNEFLCLKIACTIFNQARISHLHFCRGLMSFLATRIWIGSSRFTFQ